MKSQPRVSEAAARYARANLSEALFTATQRRILARLFDGRDRTFTVSDLIRITGAGSGAVQRELARLAGSGLLAIDHIGNQKRYRANPDSPIHHELVAIVQKTFGLTTPLREALQPLAHQIDLAFVYGSIAKGTDTTASDVDLMIISETIGYAEAIGVLHPLTETLGREINPTIYSRSELEKRLRGGSAFLERVKSQPKIWLYGTDDDLPA